MPMHRRDLLKLSAGLTWAGLTGESPAAASEGEFCKPNDPLQSLLDGNRRFCAAWSEAIRNPETTLGQGLQANRCFNAPAALVDEQHPWATVLTCADSRVTPSWIFDTTPGELFVIRSAGNTAFDAAIASIDYSISVLGSPLVMVMGHSGCGAVAAALMENSSLSPPLERLVNPIRDQIAGSRDLKEAICKNAHATATNLRQRSNVLVEAERDESTRLVVSYFDLASGAVSLI